jgi:hypothetical protein
MLDTSKKKKKKVYDKCVRRVTLLIFLYATYVATNQYDVNDFADIFGLALHPPKGTP